ncbi:MAG: PA2779 family protein [Gammaproteobacteria bacterium]|nr:hypothetical protein [Gammaproteobacteria bacterium]
MKRLLQKSIVYVLIASLVSLASPAVAQAQMIGTLTGLRAVERDANLAKVSAVLARAEVRDQMKALGVDATLVEARLAALTDAELSQLAQNIDSAPAGGVLAVIGVVFIVLLILEAVGVIDIFKKFP